MSFFTDNELFMDRQTDTGYMTCHHILRQYYKSFPYLQVYYNGYHGDLSETYLVGDVDQEAKFLVDVARQCRDAAIALLRPGLRFSEIGRIIE